MTQKVRQAGQADLPVLKQFMGQAGLNEQGLKENVDNYLLMEDEAGQASAIIGIEQIGEDGLLRSLVFTSETKQSLLLVFFQGIVESARQKKMKNLFLLTQHEQAARFFEAFHFQRMENIPLHIQKTDHFIQTKDRFDPIVMMCEI